ncbi:DUF4203 domain-containing protein [Mesorhizobium sp. VNQ89]|uniref:TM7S3/TM198-like domain-containing protein n=1 Tax=Mesorhizobium quangtriensis TaxID=3157709 RepID=UPI0032B71D5E
MTFLIGSAALVFGALVALAGLRLFVILLPIWGFMVGFILGAALITALFGDGFLATTLGIATGFVFGFGFALLSYFYWYVGVLLSAGAAGFVLGAALLGTFGVSADWLIFLFGMVVAFGFIAFALAINYPVYLMIVATASAGTSIALAGAFVLVNQVEPAALGTGEAWRMIGNHWLPWIVWLVGTVVGIGAQLSALSRIKVPEDKWASA